MFQNVYLTNKIRKKRIKIFLVFVLRNLKKDLSNLFSNIDSFSELIPKYIYPYRNTKLCSLFQKYHSDKGSFVGIGMHNYSTIYDILFNDFIGKNISLFEMGIGTLNINIQSNMGRNGTPGASLFAWREYFVNAIIYAADIDKTILFNDQNISTFYCDQTSLSSIKDLIVNTEYKKYDIVIDDGLHTFDANRIFFENFKSQLNLNGFYVVEDVLNSDLYKWENYIEETTEDFICSIIKVPNCFNVWDNNIIVFKKIRNKVNFQV